MNARFDELKKQGWSVAEIAELAKSLQDAAHKSPPDLSVRVANIVAGRRWEPKPECAMAGRMKK